MFRTLSVNVASWHREVRLPPSNSGKWRFVKDPGSPTKNVMILVVTLTVRGPHPTYHLQRTWCASGSGQAYLSSIFIESLDLSSKTFFCFLLGEMILIWFAHILLETTNYSYSMHWITVIACLLSKQSVGAVKHTNRSWCFNTLRCFFPT